MAFFGLSSFGKKSFDALRSCLCSFEAVAVARPRLSSRFVLRQQQSRRLFGGLSLEVFQASSPSSSPTIDDNDVINRTVCRRRRRRRCRIDVDGDICRLERHREHSGQQIFFHRNQKLESASGPFFGNSLGSTFCNRENELMRVHLFSSRLSRASNGLASASSLASFGPRSSWPLFGLIRPLICLLVR